MKGLVINKLGCLNWIGGKQVEAVKFLTAWGVDCLLDNVTGRGYQKTRPERMKIWTLP
jgi:hypothetical protein